MFLFNIFIILFLFILGILMPFLTRKEIQFGVRIPEDKLEHPQIKSYRKDYFKAYSLICGLYILAFIVFQYFYPAEIVILPGILVYLIISTLIYYFIHTKLKSFKVSNSWGDGKKEVVVVDTSFRNMGKKYLVSQLWFLIPIIIVLMNIVIGFSIYESLPDKIAIHWNAASEVDRWSNKTYGVIFQIPVIQVFLTAIMFVSYKSIGWAKLQINVNDPESSKERNRLFRLSWSGYMVFITIIILVLLTYTNFNILGVLKNNAQLMTIINISITAIIVISAAVMALMTGQGGNRIKLKAKKVNAKSYIDKDDDNYWKLGFIYFNPKDPAFIVEKRFGIGWTLNWGNPLSALIMICLILSIVLLKYITNILS